MKYSGTLTAVDEKANTATFKINGAGPQGPAYGTQVFDFGAGTPSQTMTLCANGHHIRMRYELEK